MRVALLTNILTPYRVPVYQLLARTPGWRLRVFVNARGEAGRHWCVDAGDLDLELAGNTSLVWRGRTLHLPWGLLSALRRFAPDVVVSGEAGARTLVALAYCALLRVPLVIWCYPPPTAAWSGGFLRAALHRLLLSRARTVIGMGRAARRVLLGWGVPDSRIFDAPNAHDGPGLAKALAALDRESAATHLRAGLGCRDRIALVAGRLVPEKGIAELLRAWDVLAPGLRAGWSLLFVGSGPLAGALRRAREHHPAGEIAHVPELPVGELAALYASADLLVFPTLGDTWGLVVNEALACGLPVLCSTLAGCAEDVLVPGRNGWLVDPRDPAALAASLERAMTDPQRGRLAAAAPASVARFSAEAMAEGFRRAVAGAA